MVALMWRSVVVIYFSLASFSGVFFELIGPSIACPIVWTSNTLVPGQFGGVPGSIESIAMSSDGRFIAVVKAAEEHGDTILSLFSSNSSRPLWNFTLAHNDYAFEFLSISEDGSYLSVSGDRTAEMSGTAVFSRLSSVPVWTQDRAGYNTWSDAYLSGNGRFLVIDNQKETFPGSPVHNSLSLLRIPSKTRLWHYDADFPIPVNRGGTPISVSYEGAYIATIDPMPFREGTYGPNLRLFSQLDNRTIWTANGNWTSVRMSGNGDRIVAANATMISAFANDSNQTLVTISLAARTMRISRDGSTLAATSQSDAGETFHVYDLERGRELFSVKSPSWDSYRYGLSSDGSTIVLLNSDRVFVYDPEGHSVCTTNVSQIVSRGDVAVSGDGRSVAVAVEGQLSYISIVDSSQAFMVLVGGLVGTLLVASLIVSSILVIRRRHLSEQVAASAAEKGGNDENPRRSLDSQTIHKGDS